MRDQISELAFAGRWDDLLPLLRRNPSHANSVSKSQGYAPLHQAAWHGAPLPVIGELLALGADRSLMTSSKRQTAREIAQEKHPERADLQFLLDEKPRTLAQLMRKILADNPDLFPKYSCDRTLFDRIVECFGSDLCHPQGADVERRLEAAIVAITGLPMAECRDVTIVVPEGFFGFDPSFWRDRFLPLMRDCAAEAHTIPLDANWVVVADLFYPAPLFTGTRGDDFLFIEMAQALCHVPLPESRLGLFQLLASAFCALTGEELGDCDPPFIPRFARGGMSSGEVSNSAWEADMIPVLLDRADWLRQSWSCLSF